MSVFSVIKRGRQQAKEQVQKQAEQKQKEAEKPAYKHVPTHAAQDALSSAPPTWRLEDRPRILEQNRRRSAMAASGMNMNIPGPSSIRRASSGLSNVMYPTAHSNPMVGISRSHSYNGGTQGWPYRNSEVVVYSPPDPPYIPSIPGIPSTKRKEAERLSMFEAMRTSSSLGKGNDSSASSDNSSSSQDELDLTSPRPMYGIQQMGPGEAAQAGRSSAPVEREVQGLHRLHPSRSRRSSDASERGGSGPAAQVQNPHQQSSPRDSRPPPSMRGFSAIPPPRSYPPIQLPGNLFHPPSTAASSVASTVSSNGASVAGSCQSQGSGTSSPPSSTASSPIRTTELPPIIPSSNGFVFPFMSDSTPPSAPNGTSGPVASELARRPVPSRVSTLPSRTAPAAGTPAPQPTLKHRARRISNTARFADLETIESSTSSSFSADSAPPSLSRKYSAPPQISNDVINRALARQFQLEPAALAPAPAINQAEDESVDPRGKGKLTKSRSSKLSKKSRWSRSSNQAVAAS